eukprot:CAMPEP_0197686992 /NCGR_PEP_ID=MMETSP1338-20131121/103341_1 /TAXON_ID=43686 ORGANISM="Pelagodinium beii, Strain RCC1491" /NCGR_SAMPLE_ID=MMETSP1338 /ASSEMBLY_ACC=CAM_ASM_000754 /LENGTH=584 /DNA_ID=CAMNT_0043269017 /DNA_START=44 /DNA_END=1795 /DNA_ORIENTATION=-
MRERWLLDLEDRNWKIRLRAVNALRDFVEAAHAAVATCLSDDHSAVRWAALDVLGTLDKTVLEQHLDAVALLLTSEHWRERQAALAVLSKLDAPSLAGWAATISAAVNDPEPDVCLTAVDVLRKLEPALEDERLPIRHSALRGIGKLKGSTLEGCADALLECLKDPATDVREEGLKILSGLSPDALALHTAALEECLSDKQWRVRRAAAEAMRKLEPPVLAVCGTSLAKRLKDHKWNVRQACALTLAQLPPSELAVYAEAVAELLQDENWRVCHASIESLASLDPGSFGARAEAVADTLREGHCKVCSAVIRALARLHPAVLMSRVGLITVRAEGDSCFCFHILSELSQLSSELLSAFEGLLLRSLDDPDWRVCELAVRTVSSLDMARLQGFMFAILQHLEDEQLSLRRAVFQVLRKIGENSAPLLLLAVLRREAADAIRSLGFKSLLDAFAEVELEPGLVRGLQAVLGEAAILHGAVCAGDSKVVQALLASAAELELRDAEGNTSLHLAARGGHLDICRSLLRARARVNARNDYCQTPVDLAESQALADFLFRAGASHAPQSQSRKTETIYCNGESLLLQKEL